MLTPTSRMKEQNQNEIIIRFGVIGLAVGVLGIFLVYLVLFRTGNTAFTFQALGGMHRNHPVLLLADLFPLLGIVLGVVAGMNRYRQWSALAEKIRLETGKNHLIREFTEALIEGDLQHPVSTENLEPALAGALNNLREWLLKNRESERQRRLEEKQRNWIAEGLARFDDILRSHSDDISSMAYAVISTMVSYLDANQGAFYTTREGDEKKLVMIACHAYHRKKFPGMEIDWGDGLIGAVAMEKKGYYTEKIPDGYLTITSGLGKANPNCLLIEPLIWNDKVYGIMELASFKSIEPYQRQFVSRVTENVATTLNTMNSSIRTGLLLKETQAQAEQLARKEEQVRQNMEALKLTQEEAAAQAETFISFTNTVNHTLMRAEYRTDGTLLYANTRFLKRLGYSGNREVEGKHISIFINEKDRPWFDALWDNLSKGGKHFEGYMKHETKLGQDLWTMATYTCVRKEDGSVEKILFLAIDSTEQKKQSLDYEGQIEAIDKLNAKAIFAPDGRLISSNNLFGTTMKYAGKELTLMNVFDFFGPSDQERFSEIWEKVVRGEPFQGQLKMISKYGEELWFRATYLSVDDMYGEVEKVVFLANEITKEKEMELASRKQHDQLVRKEEEIRLTSLDLKKKLEEVNLKAKEEKLAAEKQVKQYAHVLHGIPYPVVTINNQGFILFFNRAAEKAWDVAGKDILGRKADSLFGDPGNSLLVRNFGDPAKTKTAGMHPSQEVAFGGGRKETRDILLIRTDLKEEVQYSMVVL